MKRLTTKLAQANIDLKFFRIKKKKKMNYICVRQLRFREIAPAQSIKTTKMRERYYYFLFFMALLKRYYYVLGKKTTM